MVDRNAAVTADITWRPMANCKLFRMSTVIGNCRTYEMLSVYR
jgi:hypothetical protein